MEAREAALDARESQLDATKSKIETEKKTDIPAQKNDVESPGSGDRRLIDEQMLAAFRAQMPPVQKNAAVPQAPVNEKLRLQKVYKLFKWTHQSVKKFGHDRLEIILESYRAMGYITKESCDEIREISRLMPANLGEEHEVGPDEFVAELYSLNRILAPTDTSLDRDMIEVMMEQRQQESGGKEEDRLDISRAVEKKSTRIKEKDDEWMNLPDRI
jgi:hypothetical protein